MANADGSIVIDTRLDNSGFESGSKKMQSAMNGLQDSVETFGKQAQASINSITPALQNAAQQADVLSGSLTESQFNKAAEQMEASVERLQTKIVNLRQRAEQGFSSEAQAQKWQADLQKIEQEAQTLQQKMQDLGSQTVKAESLVEMEKEAEQLEQKLFALYEKRDTMQDLGADTASASWKNLEAQIKKTEEALDRVERGIAAKTDPSSMESAIGGAGYTSGVAQEGFAALSDSMNKTIGELRDLSGTTAEYEAENNRAGSSASTFGSILSSVAGSAINGMKTMFSGLTSALATAGRAALTTASNLAKLPFQAIGKAANFAKKAMTSFGNNTKNTTLTSNGLVKSLLSVKRMLLTRVKRMFIGAIFNQVKASLHSLAKFSDEFNTSMSNLKNSAKTMSGNLAVSFGNLVNAVAPALQTIINWLSQAISYLNAFIALLQGKKSVTVAKKSTDDYAQSLQNASGAAKDLNHQLYGFDELTKQESDSGGKNDPGAQYEDQDIEDLLPGSLKTLFDNIKKAFEAGEFEKVGQYIAQGLNKIIVSIDDWINNKFRPAGVKWAGIIARILNGLVDGLDWVALGKVFGDGLNAIIDIGYTFLTTFDWAKFGQKLAEGVNSLFDTIDWDLLGAFFAAKMNALILTISNFVANLDWAKIGSSIGRGINSWFTNIKWVDLTDGIVNGVNGIVTAIQTFLDTVDWPGIRETFINGINSLVHKINWAGLIATITFGFLGFISSFWQVVAGVDWPGLAKSFADGVNKVFGTDDNGNPNFDWDGLTNGITGSINGVVQGIKDFIIDVKWDDVSKTFSDGVNKIFSGINWTNLVFTLFFGLTTIIKTLFSTIASINWSELGKSIADGLNKVFGKSSGQEFIDWGDLGKQFGDAVKGIIDGIDSFITETDWQAVGTAIGDALGNIDWVGIATKLIGLLWDAIWGAVELLGGLTQRLVELIFGTKEEQLVLPDVFTGEVESQLKEQAGKAGESAATYMSESFADAVNREDAQMGIIAAAAAMGTGFQDEMFRWLEDGGWQSQFGEQFSTKANDLFRSISLDAATVDSVKAAFSSAGIEVTDGFATAITGKGAENIGAALTLLAAGVDQDTIAALDMTNLHANLFAYMNETGKSLEEVAGELASSTGDAMGRLMPEGMIQGYEAGKSELEAKADELEDLASTKDSRETITEEAGTTGKDTVTEIGKTMSENKDTVGEATDEVKEEISDPLSALPDEVKPYAESIMSAVTTAIVNGDPIAVAAIEAATQAIVEKAEAILSSGKGDEIGTTFINGISNGIIYNYSPIVTNMDEIGSQIVEAVEGHLNNKNGESIGAVFVDAINSGIVYAYSPIITNMSEIGSQVLKVIQHYINESNGETIGGNMIIGMINGFNDYGQTLVDTIAHICSVCVDEARRILGIASPSKVFEAIGEYVMEGMENGLDATGKDAINTVGDIAQAMTEEAEKGNGIHVAIDAVADGLDGAENSLMRIADIFIGIADSLAEMGGLVVPAVANGQVLPYNASALANSERGTVDNSSRIDGLEEALYNAISRAQSNSDNTDPITIKLEIDGREMADVVTRYQRQQNRAWG